MTQSPGASSLLASTSTSELQQQHTTRARQQQPAHRIESSAMNAPAVNARRDDPESGATQRNETKATIGIVQQRRQRGNRAGGGMRVRENEKGESEPSGSSELCQSGTEMAGNVGGLRGTEESVQLFGGTAADEHRCSGGTASAGKQRGQQSAVVTQSQSQSQPAAAAAAAAVATDSDREVAECSTDGRSVADVDRG